MRKEKPTVINLFAGCGGLSKGFLDAGFNVALAVEIDKWACETFETNFPKTTVLCADVREVTASHIRRILKAKPDVIVGGPPCQGFSASVPGGPNRRNPKDPRNSLFMDFIRFVDEMQPKAFLIENVPGLLTSKTQAGKKVIDVATGELRDCGYYVKTALLNACNWGVPQNRRRVFIAGTTEKVTSNLFPNPTHVEKPRRTLGGSKLKPYVTLWEAISDLPQIPTGVERGRYEYLVPPQNKYQMTMRRRSHGVYNHVPMKHYKRSLERFKHINCGQSLSDVPRALGPRKRGSPHELSDKKPFDQNVRKLHPHKVSHTVTASFYANFLHPYLDRNFTAREAARLQSFPDTFLFKGRKTVPSMKLLAREGRFDEMHLCQFAQIGNAVPPLLAQALASHLRKVLHFKNFPLSRKTNLQNTKA